MSKPFLAMLITLVGGFIHASEPAQPKPAVSAEVQLPGRVLLEVEQHEIGDVVTVALQKSARGNRVLGPVLIEKTAPKTSALPFTMVFDNVPPGDYVALLQGDAPTERLAEPVTVGRGSIRRSLP